MPNSIVDIKDSEKTQILHIDTEEKFKVVYNKYTDILYSYIHSKVGNEKIAEDILQEVFIDFWEKRTEIKSSLYGFLLQMCKYKIFNYYRSERVRGEYILHLSNFLTEINERTPYKYVEAKDILHQIELLIKNLPPKCRKVFYMNRFEQKSIAEIADELNISKRTVENYITTSLTYIKKHNSSLYFIIVFYLNIY
ncbi:RNA polymerase sigma-70 factor [Sphingobacterium composti Ten et al. 2007 non Yoo et al. 2007]|uniref:RNA polymerase sigma-70 factor n=1 Tax=Sphingobacterium composti TaxID=363260 RepID=UPI00135C8F5C|nr:RNA polymerase sigma-70 factor [Sphingobacterium composti Ten et al. 2007 non Yoo et al. 2007]